MRQIYHEAALSSLEAASTSPASEASPAAHFDSATVITKIIDRVTTLSTDSSDRLRGLEIAEVCSTLRCHILVLKELILTFQLEQGVLHSVECYRDAKLSAEKAKKHARDAELNAQRAGVEIDRLQRLCETDFDTKTRETIQEMIQEAGLAFDGHTVTE